MCTEQFKPATDHKQLQKQHRASLNPAGLILSGYPGPLSKKIKEKRSNTLHLFCAGCEVFVTMLTASIKFAITRLLMFAVFSFACHFSHVHVF